MHTTMAVNFQTAEELKATSHSTAFDILIHPLRKDQIMPTEKRAMCWR